jgi:hypothetical protein
MSDLLTTYARHSIEDLTDEELRAYGGALRKELGKLLRRYRALRERLVEVDKEMEARK